MTAFANFVAALDADPLKRGKQFEVFVRWFLQNDPEWSTQVDQVWLWEEYPDRWGIDCGIDLVFRHKNGEMWAAQAKCYSSSHDITKHDVDKFLSESNRKGIDKRLLIATTDRIGANAKQVCDAQEKTVVRYLLSNFETADVQYPATFAELHKAKRKDKPLPRQHQDEAISAVAKNFQDADRGQLIMACGTGKTFTTLWIKENLASNSTLVLLPSLGLLSQTLHEWTLAANTPFDVLCVCSDDTVGKRGGDEAVHSVADLAFPVTSDTESIKAFLNRDGPRVVFSTYQSSPLVADAQADQSIQPFDLVIADEAHRCAGKVGSDFSTVLDGNCIRAKKRLFTTATPRTYSTGVKKAAGERGIEVVGMDDEAVFGKVLFSLSFGDAIKRGLLTNYQVVIIGVDNPTIAQWIQNRELLKTDSGIENDAESLAAQIGLLKAIKDYDLQRVISFHSRVNRAEAFTQDLQQVAQWVGDEHRPSGTLKTDFVSGAMPTDRRRRKLAQLKALGPSERGLLANARCLSEGVDVPSLDGVAFIDPRSSQIDIIQAVGRAIRLSPNKKAGAIVVPVFIEDGDSPEESIEASNFKPIWDVLNALKAHDDVLSAELDQIRTEMGRKGGSQVDPAALTKIHVDLPQSIDQSFGGFLKTQLIERTTDSWDYWYGLMLCYSGAHESSVVQNSYVTPEGHKLGAWVSNQKSRYKAGLLSRERQRKLSELPLWTWYLQDEDWERGFASLRRYIDKAGDCWVPATYVSWDGFSLGNWVNNQKQAFSTARLRPDRRLRLEQLPRWTWNKNETLWDEGFLRLQRYTDIHKTCDVPTVYREPDGYALGKWVSHQRQALKNGLLSETQATSLRTLPSWIDDKLGVDWENCFKHLCEYVEKYGQSKVPLRWLTPAGFRLGVWVSTQRKAFAKGKVSADRITKLERLPDWSWDPLSDEWMQWFHLLEDFVAREGHARVPLKHRVPDGRALGKWVQDNRIIFRQGKLSSERGAKLLALDGWSWDPISDKFADGMSHLLEFISKEGHTQVPIRYSCADGFNLGVWVQNRRRDYASGDLIQPRVEALEATPNWLWTYQKHD